MTEKNNTPVDHLAGVCCGNPTHFGSPDACTLACCEKYLTSEEAIRKAGQVAIDDLIDSEGFENASDDDFADYMNRIVDACVQAALKAEGAEWAS